MDRLSFWNQEALKVNREEKALESLIHGNALASPSLHSIRKVQVDGQRIFVAKIVCLHPNGCTESSTTVVPYGEACGYSFFTEKLAFEDLGSETK